MSVEHETHLEISCGPLRLEGALARPGAGAARGGVVICHPHPGFGGTMDNVDHFWFGYEARLTRFLTDWIASRQE